MSQKTYMYDTQWTALINAINGGDTSAIATALGQIKTSIDSITTALGSLSTDVTQDSTQWTNLINAISSGGGGGGGTIDIDATQWNNLLTEIAKGDMTATATALSNIYTRLNSIGFDSTQWTNLVNAIANQSLTVDLSNITSSVVSNLSNVSGSTLTDALNALDSTLTTESKTFDNDHLRFDIFDKFVIISGYYTNTPTGVTDLSSYFNSDQMAKIYVVTYAQSSSNINAYIEITPDSIKIVNNTGGIANLYFMGIYFRNK